MNNDETNQTDLITTETQVPAKIQEPVEGSLLLSLTELAQREVTNASAVVKTISDALTTLRLASISLTYPDDWLLFKKPDGRITAYLQDCGAERIAPLWGISITNVSNHEKVDLDGGGFLYVIRGDGQSALTGKRVVAIEGARASTDDICKGFSGAALEVKVRKMARANLDGSIVRDLTGLSNAPLEWLVAAWKNSPEKNPDFCPKGRGFGSQDERMGAGEYGDAPKCPACQTTMKLRKGKDGKNDFWGCPNYKNCGGKPITAKKVEPSAEGKTNGQSHELTDKKNALLETLEYSDMENVDLYRKLKSRIIAAKSVNELLDVEVELKEAK